VVRGDKKERKKTEGEKRGGRREKESRDTTSIAAFAPDYSS